LRTRSAGLTDFIQIHLSMDPDITLREAHDLSDRVEAKLRREFPNADVIIHQDPYGLPEMHQHPVAG
jgi:ferrous-iron efflux pump FieF